MVLVDTSVWINHFRRDNLILESLLDRVEVLSHRMVLGELACGNLSQRSKILGFLRALPIAESAGDDEVMNFIEAYSLMGQGLGLIDVHLLASARLSDAPLWTMDSTLARTANRLGIAYSPAHD
jgi:predicted nucleic acid-binding protein